MTIESHVWHVPATSTSSGECRSRIRKLLAHDDDHIDAELVVTELVTNAWQHGTAQSDIQVTVDVHSEYVRIEVCGQSDTEPMTASDPPLDRGRGLALVKSVSLDWGFIRRANRMCVWSQVNRHSRSH